jgi:Uma2 family endonuclease
MSNLKSVLPSIMSMKDVWNHVGQVPMERIRMDPPPGFATEKDVIAIHNREERLCELVDGILVEKTTGWSESAVASRLASFLGLFIDKDELGFVTGPDAAIRLTPGLVRIPDAAFVSWKQLPKEFYPTEPIPDLAPWLAIEVLSESNTKAEMDLKLRDYFLNGVRLVWYIDPDKRTAQVYTAPDEMEELIEADSLDGGDILPGFTLPLAELFRYVEPKHGAKKKKKNGR